MSARHLGSRSQSQAWDTSEGLLSLSPSFTSSSSIIASIDSTWRTIDILVLPSAALGGTYREQKQDLFFVEAEIPWHPQ